MSHSVSGESLPPAYRPVGIALAVGSGILIGSSFVVKKKGLLRSLGEDGIAGEGVAYLKDWVWWTGMIMMIVGEIMNFGAYAFVEAIVVTPLGALSVVVCAIMSSWFLNEKLTTLGWLACAECIFGSVIIALNGPKEEAVATIEEFKKVFLAPWFLAWGGVCLGVCFIIILFIAPRYGDKNMLWHIVVCSLFGGLSVSCIQGLGAAIVTTVRGENQFKNWFIYFLIAFVVTTLLAEVFYLNKALALFNTAMVTPTYYVIFTGCVLMTSAILYQGFKATAAQIITLVLAFFTICAGIVLLQLSRVDPNKLHVDNKTNLLLEANRQEVDYPDEVDPEKAIEVPGIDALRGTFGTVGTIVRARRRATIYSTRQRSNSTIPNGRTSALHSSTDLEKNGPRVSFVRPNSTVAHNNITSLSTPSVAEEVEEPTMSQLLASEPVVTSPEILTPQSLPDNRSVKSDKRPLEALHIPPGHTYHSSTVPVLSPRRPSQRSSNPTPPSSPLTTLRPNRTISEPTAPSPSGGGSTPVIVVSDDEKPKASEANGHP